MKVLKKKKGYENGSRVIIKNAVKREVGYIYWINKGGSICREKYEPKSEKDLAVKK